MSIRAMSTVWEHSTLSGTELLLMLAIADHANDNGVAWPSVETLAKKIRMSERACRYLLPKIAATGELAIERNAGPKGCNLFRVQVLQAANLSGVQSDVGGGAKSGGSGGATAIAPEPSVNRKEPSSMANWRSPIGSKSKKLTCPVEAIVDLYHECMPNNPRVKVLNDGRRKAIGARWADAAVLTCKPFGYSTRDEGLAAWREFFETCNESKFLTGKNPPSAGYTRPFVADIDYLFKPDKFAWIIENKYHREAA